MKKIPKDFYNSNEQERAWHCKICDTALFENNQAFALETALKVFPEIKAKEIIFEIAVCHACAGENRKSLSKQSLDDIETFMTGNQVRNNMMKCVEESYENGGDTFGYCLVTGVPKDNINEFQIMAQCQGEFLIPGTEAFMISKEGIEIIHDLLSPETKEELDRFKNEHFGVPPEFENLLNPGDLVFL